MRTMARKVYLEYREGTSSKFWSVTIDGRVALVRWGKIGSRGVQQEIGIIEGLDRLEEKKRKGYQVISEEIYDSSPAVEIDDPKVTDPRPRSRKDRSREIALDAKMARVPRKNKRVIDMDR